MNCNCWAGEIDHGINPYVVNVEWVTVQNQNFRTAVWTGCHLQMTLMCIPQGEEIGLEMHADTDQFIRVEQGCAVVKMGRNKHQLNFCQNLSKGDGIFIPSGTWHNIINMGTNNLKLSSIYAPPHHPKGTIHYTKADAEKSEK